MLWKVRSSCTRISHGTFDCVVAAVIFETEYLLKLKMEFGEDFRGRDKSVLLKRTLVAGGVQSDTSSSRIFLEEPAAGCK